MSVADQNILQSFEFLPDFEQQKSASEIIKRSLETNLPVLSENDLISLADELFLEFDRRESKKSSVK
jgi:hypothetical protein